MQAQLLGQLKSNADGGSFYTIQRLIYSLGIIFLVKQGQAL